MKLIVHLICICMLYSCVNTNSKHDSVEINALTIEGYDNPIKNNAEDLDVEIYKTIKLQTSEDNLLRNLTKVLIVNDSIVIVSDFNCVQGYSLDGDFICNYGTKGNGAGDYINLGGFFVNHNNEVVIIDNYRSTLLKYNLNGSFVGKIDIEKPTLQTVRDGLQVDNDIILFNEYITANDNPLYISYDIKKNEIIDEIPLPVHSDGIRYTIGQNPMTKYNDRILLLNLLSPYLYDWKGNALFKFATKRKVLTKEYLEKISDYSFDTFADLYAKGIFMGFTDIYETSKYILCMCSNLEYILVDKQTLTCQKYDYTLNNTLPPININPIINIVGCYDDYYIGNLSYQSIMQNNKLTEALMKRWNCETSQDANPVLIFFQINRLKTD